ncbi:hypothetical protein [Nocardia sp. BMG51109]|uniref:hypothetical protein n=1 Tax=Nocardia sp. BMG51109 TaxID=1056816 RepID=UPI0018DD02B3|nr:hypothetical protein [Nocardia sp. BMG51109]
MFDALSVLVDDLAVLAETSDPLVHHLFDIGLRLHHIRRTVDRPDLPAQQIRAARDAITDVVCDLDTLIGDAARTMLTVTARIGPLPDGRPGFRGRSDELCRRA